MFLRIKFYIEICGQKYFLEKIDFWEGKLDGGLMADILFLFFFKWPGARNCHDVCGCLEEI